MGNCVVNQYYGDEYADAYGYPYYDDQTGAPCDPSQSPSYSPSQTPVFRPAPVPSMTSIPNSGVTVQPQDPLSKILQGFLSATALITHQPAIPTQASATQYTRGGGIGITDATTLALLQRQQIGGGGNFGGQLQNFVQNNTGVLLIGGLVFAAFMMKPPTRR